MNKMALKFLWYHVKNPKHFYLAHVDLVTETLDAATVTPRNHSNLNYWAFWFIDVPNFIKIGDGAVQHCPC